VKLKDGCKKNIIKKCLAAICFDFHISNELYSLGIKITLAIVCALVFLAENKENKSDIIIWINNKNVFVSNCTTSSLLSVPF